MRLIDGDKLYKTLAKPSDIPGDTIDVMTVRLAILAAPEVEAIPKEWIEEWGWKNGMSESMSLRVMIEDWGKENE